MKNPRNGKSATKRYSYAARVTLEKKIAKQTKMERALELALNWHEGQRDTAGKPYILHLIRIMLRMGNEDEQVVALLHDSLEDVYETKNIDHEAEIRRRQLLIESTFGTAVLNAAWALTHPKDEDYLSQYIPHVKKAGKLAVKVKLADLEDNMNVGKLPKAMTATDIERIRKYHEATLILYGCKAVA
jgi:(p)ppGpp synthase/HD superfamily hydrolase